MKKIFFVLLISSFSSSLFSYPITPRPLRKLIIESENIVWAKVLKIDTEKQNDEKDIWASQYALLQINEMLQGDLKACLVKVYFSSGMICPAPGVFYEGEEVLTFLDKREKKEGFWVHALSYGVKHKLGENGYNVYKERIKEMQALLAKKESREKNDQILEWLVKCAEHKATRWEGTYELSPESDFMSYYDKDGPVRRDIFLNKSQRQRIFDALLTTDTLEYDDLSLVDISSGINDSAMLCFLKEGLLKVKKDYAWNAYGIMERIVLLTANDTLEKLMEKFEKVYLGYDKQEEEEAKRLLLLFIDKMKNAGLKQTLTATGDNDS